MGIFKKLRDFFTSDDGDLKSREGKEHGETVYRQDRHSGQPGEEGKRDHEWYKVNKSTGKYSEGSAGRNSKRSKK